MSFNRFLTFYKIWIKDLFKIPSFPIFNKRKDCNRLRLPIRSNKVYICIHEWGGYEGKRVKHVKKIHPFEVGLDYQLNRFNSYKGNHDLVIHVTMSDMQLCKNIPNIRKQCNNLISVPNIGMDFSGYSEFFNRIKDLQNAYVILTNSSVNRDSEDCIDSIINYFENNQDIGMLGASSSSRYYHTCLRWNFNPHLQSFFLLTTIDVLKEAIALNNDEFPGIHETNKHLLIRNGEVKLSKLILDLGYNLAVVNEHGVFKFNNSKYPLPKGDFRQFTRIPNKLYSIEK